MVSTTIKLVIYFLLSYIYIYIYKCHSPGKRIHMALLFVIRKKQKHLVIGQNTNFRHLPHLTLSNWCEKYIYIFIGALYII